MSEEDDFDIEDILGNLNKKKAKKKKKDSKDAGVRGEKDLILSFLARWPQHKFFRVVGSGARTSQVQMSDENLAMFTGDIVCPSSFRFTVECKYGYDNIEIVSMFTDGNKQVDEWIKQSERQAGSINKLPLLCWRRPNRSWLAWVPKSVFSQIKPKPTYYMAYRHLYIVSLSSILSQPDSFWFDVKE